jgi:hypothetical protein
MIIGGHKHWHDNCSMEHVIIFEFLRNFRSSGTVLFSKVTIKLTIFLTFSRMCIMHAHFFGKIASGEKTERVAQQKNEHINY